MFGNKFNLTMMEKFGVEWAQQSKNISDKSKKTFNENPNREEIIKNRTNSYKFYIDNREDIFIKRSETIKKIKWHTLYE
jgi:hypothetical protein